MAADDLTRPLGTDSRVRRRLALPLTRIAAGLVGAVVVIAGLWIVVVDDPTGGEPHTLVRIEETDAVSPAAAAAPGPARQQAVAEPRAAAPADPNAPVLTELTPPDGAANLGDGVVIRDPSTDQPLSLSALPEAALLEPGPDGPLPRTAESGRRPFDAYARPAGSLAAGSSRIAIVVSGLGISQTGTESALDQLPGVVSLAFAPYGKDLPRWVARAREQGHEVLLQLPLEPFDFPNNDPGPQTLLVDDSGGENAERLRWLLSRFTTYAGVISYMGGRFTSDPAALQTLMAEVGRRGLMYVDDGSSTRSRAADVAPGSGAPFAAADVVLDGVAEPAAIDDRIAQLESIAREKGSAVGMASAFPASLERIAAWAAGAADRGIVLVPVTALAKDAPRDTAATTP
jgi:polysaccharide deacetylase 2 family uncharacterized protein YibQ